MSRLSCALLKKCHAVCNPPRLLTGGQQAQPHRYLLFPVPVGGSRGWALLQHLPFSLLNEESLFIAVCQAPFPLPSSSCFPSVLLPSHPSSQMHKSSLPKFWLSLPVFVLGALGRLVLTPGQDESLASCRTKRCSTFFPLLARGLHACVSPRNPRAFPGAQCVL